ncbi:alpha/beta hydrolase [Permianibacter aggregans]|nr:alpha/beta hydrolase-fold protein [Permianibacter aggregans]
MTTMKNLTSLLMLGLLLSCAKNDPIPVPSAGSIERIPMMPSQHVPARHIDVWLPKDYPAQAPYAVLYMHDGQMLFDANTTWNKQEWRIDEVASELMQAGKVKPFIVVGIWNAGSARTSEYFPQRAFEMLEPAVRQQMTEYYQKAMDLDDDEVVPVYSDRYLKFLVEELKPVIEQRYRVSAAQQDTFLMGSSMGGLISMYGLAEYPRVFGGAACLSTHWPGNMGDGPDNPVPSAFYSYIEKHFPPPGSNRIYFDHGTETLDASYADRQLEVDRRMKQKAYGENDWMTRTFPGADHSEKAWAARVHIPLEFLLKKSPDSAEKLPE